MKARTVLCVAMLAGAIIFVTGQVVPQDKSTKPGGPEQESSDEMDAMMQEWAKYAKPGEHHARLQPLIGRWNLTIRSAMAPGQPMQESTGTAEYEWILGGRYVLEKVRGNPETEGQTPFEAMGVHGYDNLKQKYVAMWIDNMMTGLFTSEGTCDASGKIITLLGEDTDPTTGKAMQIRSVLRIVDDNKWVSETYCQGPDGKEFMAVELTYTRKK